MRIGIEKLFTRCLVLILLIVLNACTTVTSTRDGPPPFPVDETRIPDAVPKKEQLSKFGNMRVYRVKGRAYQVMTSAKHYRARGVASWYGTKFHKQRTSSGEPYNMLAMTAAHKSLPLPTYVRVTNLANRKKVIVKVNDRGPFSDNRLIDLSYVAAKKLGMIGRGTAYVQVEAISFEKERRPIFFADNSSSRNPRRKNFLQVGAFKNIHRAERLRKRLLTVVNRSPIQIDRSQHLYRVKIGPIQDLATKESISNKLRAIGLNPTSN